MTSKQYLQEVTRRLNLPEDAIARIKADLLSDISIALEQGENMDQIIQRMGTPAQLADEFNENYGGDASPKPYMEYKTSATFLGMPLVHVVKLKKGFQTSQVGFLRIASIRGINIGGRGVHIYDSFGNLASIPTAKGVLAIGPKAIGLLSFGLFSMGLFSVGIMSLGLLSLGILSLGLLSAAVVSMGLFTMGISTIGFASIGVAAVGYYALGVDAEGFMTLSLNEAENIPMAIAGFMNYLRLGEVSSWVTGFYQTVLNVFEAFKQDVWASVAVILLVFVLLSLIAILGWRKAKNDTLAEANY